jgi:hypothetical protein
MPPSHKDTNVYQIDKILIPLVEFCALVFWWQKQFNNLAMKSLLILCLAMYSWGIAISQGCLPEGIIL